MDGSRAAQDRKRSRNPFNSSSQSRRPRIDCLPYAAPLSLPPTQHILKSQGNRHILPGVKCTLIQRCCIRQLSNAREVAAAAAAAELCRQRLVLKQDQGVLAPPSPRPLSIPIFPPPAPSLACIPILLAALTPAFSSRQSPQRLLSLLVHAGISSDDSIPYISHAQMAAIGVQSHMTHAVLTLVRPLFTPYLPSASAVHSLSCVTRPTPYIPCFTLICLVRRPRLHLPRHAFNSLLRHISRQILKIGSSFSPPPWPPLTSAHSSEST